MCQLSNTAKMAHDGVSVWLRESYIFIDEPLNFSGRVDAFGHQNYVWSFINPILAF